MNVLVLNLHYWPEIAPTGQLLQDVCEDLAQSGHDVTVICGQPSYRFIEGVERRAPATSIHHGVSIHRVWSYIPTRRSVARRVLNYGSYFGSSLVRALHSRKPDVALIMSSPPLLLGLSAELLQLLRGVPYVYSVQDIYPDIAVSLGVLRPGLVLDAIESASSFIYKRADQVVTLSSGMAGRLQAKGVLGGRITVIPNWADTNSVQPRSKDTPLARAHGLVDKFVVQYSGNVGLSQGLEHVVTAAGYLRDLPIKFVIVGDGNARESLQRLVQNAQLDNVEFLPPQRREVLPELLASCDVGLVSTKHSVSSELVPSKLYGILASGRPVLAAVSADSEVARVVRESRCGAVVPPEDPFALAECIRAMHANPTLLAEQGARGRTVCEQHFSREVCTRAYSRVLTRAAGSARSSAS